MPDVGTDWESRLRALEQQLELLKIRLEELERRIGPRVEHPADTAVVREKVAYDWQR
jgi:hypothetical protein